jgi:hypothetical protein
MRIGYYRLNAYRQESVVRSLKLLNPGNESESCSSVNITECVTTWWNASDTFHAEQYPDMGFA